MGEALREIDAGVIANPDGFRTQIAEPCVPAVLRGACRDWPARRAGEDATAALFAYLRRFDSGATGQAFVGARGIGGRYHYGERSEEHTSELQSLMRISYAVFCLKKKKETLTIKLTTEQDQQNYNFKLRSTTGR